MPAALLALDSTTEAALGVGLGGIGGDFTLPASLPAVESATEAASDAAVTSVLAAVPVTAEVGVVGIGGAAFVGEL